MYEKCLTVHIFLRWHIWFNAESIYAFCDTTRWVV